MWTVKVLNPRLSAHMMLRKQATFELKREREISEIQASMTVNTHIYNRATCYMKHAILGSWHANFENLSFVRSHVARARTVRDEMERAGIGPSFHAHPPVP